MIDDADQFIKQVEERYKSKIPIGLIGYSLGGGISLSLLIKYPERFSFFLGIAPLIGFTDGIDLKWAKTKALKMNSEDKISEFPIV